MHTVDLLQTIVKMNEYDIVGINESGLDMKRRNLQSEIYFQGLRTLSIDKPTPSKRDGGSVIYVKEALRSILCTAIASTILCGNPG